MLSRLSIAAACASVVIAAAADAWLEPARADYVITSGCVRSGGLRSCTTIFRRGTGGIPGVVLWTPRTEKEAAEATERDRLWLARCRPTTEHDQYGVKHYRYAAAGCEFGRYEE